MNNTLIIQKNRKNSKYINIEIMLARWGTIKRELRGISNINNIVVQECDSYLLKKQNYLSFEDFRAIDSFANFRDEQWKEFLVHRYVECYTYDIIAWKMHCSTRTLYHIKEKILKELSELLDIKKEESK